MSEDIYKIDPGLPTSKKIIDLNDMVISLDGKIAQAQFNKNEVGELYSGAGFSRKYIRNVSLGHTPDTYTDWSHLKAEAGYSIWQITPDNYDYADENNLYFDNQVLTNKGEASSEDVLYFDDVFLYDGSTYTDDTDEAKTETGTAFNLNITSGSNSYLYMGSASTFKGAKFEFDTRGSNYTLETQIFCSGSGINNWVNLTSCDGYDDDTSDFESDGNIEWHLDSDTGAGWVKTTINNVTGKYWARIQTITIPATVAKANYLIPASSVIGLLALSSSEIQNEEWVWCTCQVLTNINIYVTIRNTGATAYEGDYYISSTPSLTNKENFFVYNHEFLLDHVDDRFDYLTTNLCEEDLKYEIDGTGAGSALYSGTRGYIMHPNAGTIRSYYLLADISGDLVVDVKKGTYTNFPTLTSITGTQKPTLSSAQKSYGTNLSTWTTSISKNDILEFDVNQATTVRKATLILQVLRS